MPYIPPVNNFENGQFNAKLLVKIMCKLTGNNSVAVIGGAVAWSNLSDMRTKKDIRDIGLGLDFITSLRPVEFRMKEGDDRINLGFIESLQKQFESVMVALNSTGHNPISYMGTKHLGMAVPGITEVMPDE